MLLTSMDYSKLRQCLKIQSWDKHYKMFISTVAKVITKKLVVQLLNPNPNYYQTWRQTDTHTNHTQQQISIITETITNFPSEAVTTSVSNSSGIIPPVGGDLNS